MDTDKKREQTRERVKRYREKQKSVTNGNGSVTDVTQEQEGVTRGFIGPSVDKEDAGTFQDCRPLPENFSQPDCQCKHCRNNRKTCGKWVLNHGPYKTVNELTYNELNRVSLPGDPDYVSIGVACCGVPGGDLKGSKVTA